MENLNKHSTHQEFTTNRTVQNEYFQKICTWVRCNLTKGSLASWVTCDANTTTCTYASTKANNRNDPSENEIRPKHTHKPGSSVFSGQTQPRLVNVLVLVLCLSAISFSLVAAQTQTYTQARKEGKVLIILLALVLASASEKQALKRAIFFFLFTRATLINLVFAFLV